VADERHHARDGLLSSPAPEEDCAGAVTERFATDTTAIAGSLATMDADVAFVDLTPCATVHVRAEYTLRIDDTPPSASKHRRVSPDPLSFSSSMVRSPFSVHLPGASRRARSRVIPGSRAGDGTIAS